MSSERHKRIINDEILDSYRRMLVEDEKCPATVEKYMRDVEDFAAFTDGRKVTKVLVINYKQSLLFESSYAPRTVNSRLAAVNSFLKHMGWHECIVKTIKIQHEAFRDGEKELTRSEYERLVRAAKEKGKERICLVMQTICATGIRVSELRYITVEAVNVGHAEISMKGKVRKILIPADLQKLLILYIKKTGRESGAVFVTRNGKPLDRSNICHEMKALCEDAGVERTKTFPHNLRHLFACTYFELDKDINTLADLLGHSNLNTTRTYTQRSMKKLSRRLNRMKLAGVTPWGPGPAQKNKAA